MAIKKSISVIETHYEFRATTNKFTDLPEDLSDYLESQDGFFHNIVQELEPDNDYRITVTIEKIS